MERNVTIKKAAQMMAKSEQFVRLGLQRQILPFGTAVKVSTKWSYHISPVQFYEYIGGGQHEPINIQSTPHTQAKQQGSNQN